LTQFRIVGFLLALVVALAGWGLTCAAWRFDRVAAGVVPLEPRDFEHLTLLTLGTGGTHEDQNRRGPATAVALGRDVVLVDAGRSVAESLRAGKIPISQPHTVLLSSLMPENTLGLDDLLAMAWIDGRREPLHLLGPPGTRALAEATRVSVRRGIEARAGALGLSAEPPRFAAEEIGDGWVGRFGELAVTAGALPGGPTAALVYRFEWRGRTAVVGGAGWAPDALASFAQAAHLLVHEAVYVPSAQTAQEAGIEEDPELLARQAALYTSFEDAGRLARRAGVGTLVLVRLRPPPVFDFQISSVVDDFYDGRIVVAADGDEFTP
jgi:ribonuclease Z